MEKLVCLPNVQICAVLAALNSVNYTTLLMPGCFVLRMDKLRKDDLMMIMMMMMMTMMMMMMMMMMMILMMMIGWIHPRTKKPQA